MTSDSPSKSNRSKRRPLDEKNHEQITMAPTPPRADQSRHQNPLYKNRQILADITDSVDETAYVSRDARVDQGVRIKDHAWLCADAHIHSGSVIGSGAIIGTGTTIGTNVRVGSGAMIGAFCVIEDGVTVPPSCEIRMRTHVLTSDELVTAGPPRDED